MVGWTPREGRELGEGDRERPPRERTQMPWPVNAGTWRNQLPEDFDMPAPYNPRDWDSDPWPLDAGLIPFSMRIPEEHIDPTVEEYFERMMEAEDDGEFDLPPPWPLEGHRTGLVPYEEPTRAPMSAEEH